MYVSTVSLADHAEDAAALDFVVTFQKSPYQLKIAFGLLVATEVSYGNDSYFAIADMARQIFKITVNPDVLRRYVQLLTTPTQNAAIGAFMKRVHSDPALRQQFLSAATSYDALRQVASANGLMISTGELQNYLEPWRVFVSLLSGLVDRHVITPGQFEAHAGVSIDDQSISGYGKDVDLTLIGAALSAASWATKSTPISELSIPIAALIFPTTAVIIGGFEGQTFDFNQIGDMFKLAFSEALEQLAAQLEGFRDQLDSVFT